MKCITNPTFSIKLWVWLIIKHHKGPTQCPLVAENTSLDGSFFHSIGYKSEHWLRLCLKKIKHIFFNQIICENAQNCCFPQYSTCFKIPFIVFGVLTKVPMIKTMSLFSVSHCLSLSLSLSLTHTHTHTHSDTLCTEKDTVGEAAQYCIFAAT